MKTKNQNVTEPVPVLPTRAEEIQSILEPLNAALESVRAEVINLATARKTHETKLDGLKAQKASLEQKLKDLQGFELDVASDPVDLALEINGTRDGITLNGRRITEAEKGVPVDASLQDACRGFVAEFDALKDRILALHRRQAVIDLEKICTLPAEFYLDQEVQHGCAWCHHVGTVRVEVPTSRFIIEGAHSVRRAQCLNLRDQKPTEGFVEIAAEGLADIREELERIDDLAPLPPYEKPEAAPDISVAPVVSSWRPSKVAKPLNPQVSCLRPADPVLDGFGMLRALEDSVERNQEQLKKWQAEGTVPPLRQL